MRVLVQRQGQRLVQEEEKEPPMAKQREKERENADARIRFCGRRICSMHSWGPRARKKRKSAHAMEGQDKKEPQEAAQRNMIGSISPAQPRTGGQFLGLT